MKKELESIFRAVAGIKKEWKYSNDGEAFAHLFVRNYLNIDDAEAADSCQTGFLGHDKGIDAFYIEEDTNNIFVFGITKESGSFGPEILTDIIRAHDFLSTDLREPVKDDLRQTWMYYKEFHDKGFDVVYVMVVLGKLNEEAKNKLGKLSSELEKDRWTIIISEEQRTIGTCLPIEPKRGPNVEFEILDTHPLIRDIKGFPRATVFSVIGDALSEVVRKNRSNIFELNLREYLGPSNPVNKRIAASLTDPEVQGIFWYLNLGVDAVCDKFTIGTLTPRKTAENGAHQCIKISNFRIVNGCQTCLVLEGNIAASKNVSVMVRLVETTDPELGYKIAVAKNRQTAIKDRDLVALEDTQRTIQSRMASLDPPFFYQRREGEWKSKRRRSGERRKFGGRWIDNKSCAKAYLATLLQQPFEAKHKTKKFFQPKQDGGLYETIFHSDLDDQNLIMADEIYSTILEQNKKQRREYHQLLKASSDRKLSADETEKLKNLSYLVNADTYLAALVWHLSVKALKKDDIVRRMVSLDRPLIASKKKNIINLYGIASKQVISRLTTEESVRSEEGRSFIIRNYFATPDTYKKLKSQANLVDDEEILRALSA